MLSVHVNKYILANDKGTIHTTFFTAWCHNKPKLDQSIGFGVV